MCESKGLGIVDNMQLRLHAEGFHRYPPGWQKEELMRVEHRTLGRHQLMLVREKPAQRLPFPSAALINAERGHLIEVMAVAASLVLFLPTRLMLSFRCYSSEPMGLHVPFRRAPASITRRSYLMSLNTCAASFRMTDFALIWPLIEPLT